MREELSSLASGVRRLEDEKKALAEECKQLQTSRSRGEVNAHTHLCQQDMSREEICMETL